MSVGAVSVPLNTSQSNTKVFDRMSNEMQKLRNENSGLRTENTSIKKQKVFTDGTISSLTSILSER
jgi:hypothetical protein